MEERGAHKELREAQRRSRPELSKFFSECLSRGLVELKNSAWGSHRKVPMCHRDDEREPESRNGLAWYSSSLVERQSCGIGTLGADLDKLVVKM